MPLVASKIVLYSIYVIMYVHGNQLTQTRDHRQQTTDDRLVVILDGSLFYVTVTFSFLLVCDTS